MQYLNGAARPRFFCARHCVARWERPPGRGLRLSHSGW